MDSFAYGRDALITALIGVSGQLFGGLYGYSVAGGGEANITSPNMCAVLTVCHQFGLGVFLGGGVDASATISADNISSGTYDVWGLFGFIGVCAVVLGQISFFRSMKKRIQVQMAEMMVPKIDLLPVVPCRMG